MANINDDASTGHEEAPLDEPIKIPTNKVLEALASLTDKIARTIEEGRNEGVLRSMEEVYTRYRTDQGSLKQTEFGLERVDFTTEEFSKESWFQAMRAVVWRLQESDQYSQVLTMLSLTELGAERAKQLLNSFAHRISYKLLETDEATKRQDFLSVQLDAVKKHLDGERFRHTTEVRLLGFTPPQLGLEFTASAVDVLLRRLRPEDLVEERSSFFGRDRFPPTPTAILRLSKVVEYENEVQKAVWQATTILRLFKVASVRDLTYTNESDSFFALGGTHINHQHYSVVTTGVLQEEEKERFKEFWEAMSDSLPKEGYGYIRERVDPVHIAYNRYSDALLFWGVPTERRISDAVIGLESLFLLEDDELSYRLRLRVAKLLSLVGFDPYSVGEVIKLAYDVRSAFLHGSKGSSKTLKRINREHGSVNDLLLHVLDHLRCSIVIVTLTTMTKNELINRLDASFVDQNAWRELEEILTEARSHLRPAARKSVQLTTSSDVV